MTRLRKTFLAALLLLILGSGMAEPGGGGIIIHPKPKPIVQPTSTGR